MEKGEKFFLKIEDLGMNGEGIAHLNGQAIFVPFCLPNEEVEAEITFCKNSFCNAKVLSVIKKSTERIEPLCPYFQICGGCDLQHLNYNSALNFKTNLVKNTLKKVGNIDFEVQNCIGSNKEYFYRNKIALPVVFENGKTRLGMFEKNSHKIVEIKDCVLQNNFVKNLIVIITDYISKYNIKGFDYSVNNGLLKYVVARNVADKILITLVLTQNKIAGLNYLIEQLKLNFENFGLNININKSKNEILFGKVEPVYGIKEIEICEHNLYYNINTMSFLQVNDFIKNKIYDIVLENIDNNSTVMDAYCGAGFLTALCAKQCKKAIGIEIVKQAIENAKRLFVVNDIKNAEAHCDDCAKTLPTLKFQSPVNIIIDPPRNGCEQSVLNSILNIEPTKIIYISCSPQTLARDLKILLASNKYAISFIQPFDMFPQTKHVETLVVLKKV